MYDLLKKKIFTSKDVIFHELVFPFANTPYVSSSSQPPILSHIADIGDELILSTTSTVSSPGHEAIEKI